MKAKRSIFLAIAVIAVLAVAVFNMPLQTVPYGEDGYGYELQDEEYVPFEPDFSLPEEEFSFPDELPEASVEPQPVPGAQALEAVDKLLTFKDEKTGLDMMYWCFIPEGATVDYPVIVYLHSDEYVARPIYLDNCGIVRSAKELYGKEYPFILLEPNTGKRSWEQDKIPDTLFDLIDFFFEDKGLTSDKVALTGYDRGALGTWCLTSLYPERFTCAVPVSRPNDTPLDFEALSTVPIRAFSGSLDDDFGLYGAKIQGIVDSVNEAGGNAELIVVDGKGYSDMEYSAYTQELFEWMISN